MCREITGLAVLLSQRQQLSSATARSLRPRAMRRHAAIPGIGSWESKGSRPQLPVPVANSRGEGLSDKPSVIWDPFLIEMKGQGHRVCPFQSIQGSNSQVEPGRPAGTHDGAKAKFVPNCKHWVLFRKKDFPTTVSTESPGVHHDDRLLLGARETQLC